MQLNARDGKGIDRHLFGLWCAAFERNEEIPELFDDPLYTKSGGGGNYVLSTSTLGFTINNGFVGPMVMDGYGVFYTITNDRWVGLVAPCLWIKLLLILLLLHFPGVQLIFPWLLLLTPFVLLAQSVFG